MPVTVATVASMGIVTSHALATRQPQSRALLCIYSSGGSIMLCVHGQASLEFASLSGLERHEEAWVCYY